MKTKQEYPEHPAARSPQSRTAAEAGGHLLSDGALPRCRLAVLLLAALAAGFELRAQTGTGGAPKKIDGKAIYEKACTACHGPDGRGMPKAWIGFTPPPTFPDFADCNTASREADLQWRAIITSGGPVRAFSEIMPVFGEALTPEQVNHVIQHLRSFCPDRSWPRGDLNLPRALVTEKAFPEDEAVLTSAINIRGASRTDFKLVYERRIGARNQIEASVPFSFAREDPGGWRGGVGDLGLGFKRVVISNLRSGSILSVQGEAILPTGNRAKGFGTGVLFFETFASFGQLLPKQGFLQFQSGIELPTRPEEANKAAYWRFVLGRSISQGKGLGRMWTPMVEMLADREFAAGEKTNWDILPQFQVTLSRRQHVRAGIGVKFPVNDAGSRPTQLLFYLLWDWFDGGLREGWK